MDAETQAAGRDGGVMDCNDHIVGDTCVCETCARRNCKDRRKQSESEVVVACGFYMKMTNADCIQSMTLEELHSLLVTVAFEESPWDKLFLRECCAKCEPTTGTIVETGQEVKLYECDFTDGKCPHGDAIMWWLLQPAEEEPT